MPKINEKELNKQLMMANPGRINKIYPLEITVLILLIPTFFVQTPPVSCHSPLQNQGLYQII